jgi:hypothetical protein
VVKITTAIASFTPRLDRGWGPLFSQHDFELSHDTRKNAEYFLVTRGRESFYVQREALAREIARLEAAASAAGGVK